MELWERGKEKENDRASVISHNIRCEVWPDLWSPTLFYLSLDNRLNQQKPKVQEEKEVKQLSSLPALLSIIME
jgi:hypothetical protein